MFTGLIETTGTIRSLEDTRGAVRIAVAGPTSMVRRLRTGDSIAVSGVCLTALDLRPDSDIFVADLAAETIARTSLSKLHPGSVVNLELPTPAGTPLGGHVVQGHVDGVGVLRSLEPVSAAAKANSDWRLQIEIPENCVRYVVEKGSIAVEGISLTVAQVSGRLVTIALIPHTYAETNIHTLRVGSPVNIEVDVLAKYAERLTESKPTQTEIPELTVEYLIANGY